MTTETTTRTETLRRLVIPEWVQPYSNSLPSCPWCEGYKPNHGPHCNRLTDETFLALLDVVEAAQRWRADFDEQGYGADPNRDYEGNAENLIRALAALDTPGGQE